jgi:hypothetical protein
MLSLSVTQSYTDRFAKAIKPSLLLCPVALPFPLRKSELDADELFGLLDSLKASEPQQLIERRITSVKTPLLAMLVHPASERECAWKL